jgi:hypothetical protein
MTEFEALNRFHQELADTSESIVVYGLEFDSARILRELDPIAYREAFNSWLDLEGIDLDD